MPILRWIDYQGYVKNAVRLGERTDEFLQGLVDEGRRRKKSAQGSAMNTMIDHLLSRQESEPDYYTDQIIKGLILVSNEHVSFSLVDLLVFPFIVLMLYSGI